jgi:hypothetical protein
MIDMQVISVLGQSRLSLQFGRGRPIHDARSWCLPPINQLRRSIHRRSLATFVRTKLPSDDIARWSGGTQGILSHPSSVAPSQPSPTLMKHNRNATVVVAMLTLVTALLSISAYFLVPGVDSGMVLFGPLSEPGVADQVEFMEGALARFATIITGSFGVIAFLAAFQHQRGIMIPARAWTALSVGVVMLTCGLVFSMLGTETLLSMVADNAVDLHAPRLVYSRWALYITFLTGLLSIGVFALQIADVVRLPPVKASGPSRINEL